MRRAVGLLAALVVLAAAPAHAAVYLFVDATTHRGYMDVSVVADHGGTAMIGEGPRPDGAGFGTFSLGFVRDDPRVGPLYVAGLPHPLRWRCDRTRRRFWTTAQAPDGTLETSLYTIETPACANRLTLTAPLRSAPGRSVAVAVHDTWGSGHVRALVCARLHAEPDCRAVVLGDDQADAVATLPLARRGHWTIILRTAHERVTQDVAVGVRPLRRPVVAGPQLLVTGDSLMESVNAVLQDRLASRARIDDDVHVGGTLTDSGVIDWPALARAQVARSHPNATAIFLGTNDGFPMTPPGGTQIACCGERWIAEYARRARAVMRIYAQGGAASVFWLTVPLSRDHRFQTYQRAVNVALRRAVTQVPAAHLIPADRLFTPGGRYRPRMRQPDGTHLSLAGARIAASAVIAQLRRFGVL